MQVTIDSDDELEDVLKVLGAMYRVVFEKDDGSGGRPGPIIGADAPGVGKIRHRTMEP